MGHRRLLYTRAARTQLQALPAAVRLHLETHQVKGARVRFVVSASASVLLIHHIEALPMDEQEDAARAP